MKKQESKKFQRENINYNLLHMFDDMTYEGGLKNFFTAIDLDRVDIIEEHFRRGERKLNENYDFSSSLGFILELPLIRAIKKKSYRVMFYFLEHQANPDAFCLKKKVTCYQFAEKNDSKSLKIFDDFKKGIKTKVKYKYQPEDKKLFSNISKKRRNDDFKYKKDPLNFFESIHLDREDILKIHLETGRKKLNQHFIYPMPPGFKFSLPLIEALKSHSYKALKMLLEYGADPIVIDENIWMSSIQYAEENDEKAYQIIQNFEKVS